MAWQSFLEAINALSLIIAAFIGAVAGWLTSRAAKSQRQADVQLTHEHVQQQELANLRALWEANMEALKGQVDILTERVQELSALVTALEVEIVSLGGDPRRVRLELARYLSEQAKQGQFNLSPEE